MQVLIVGSVQFIDAFGKLIIIAITAKPSSWGVVYHLQILKLCLCTMLLGTVTSTSLAHACHGNTEVAHLW